MESKFSQVLVCLTCMLMGLAIGTVCCYDSIYQWMTQTGMIRPAASSEVSAGAAKYDEIMAVVDQCFIGEEVDETAAGDAAAEGVIASLGDRWSYYVSAADYQQYTDNISNSYVGVGITITASYTEDGSLLGYEVTEVVSGGPAQAAGVLVGDVLTAVDGTSVKDMSLTETKNMVKGAEGTTVTLTFLRGDNTVVLPVQRMSFQRVPVSGEMMQGNVGFISIGNFNSGCAEVVIDLVETFKEMGAESLLFDVRGNPGGMKTELTTLLDYLLPEGTIFHSVDYTGAEEIITSDAACVELPMAVLVNGSSYSAAEYFACALQEYGVAKVIGEQTCGKGYYQQGIRLSDGSCLNLSVGKYYTPSGISLIDTGVTPDVEIALDDELAQELACGKLYPVDDPQVSAALACLLD